MRGETIVAVESLEKHYGPVKVLKGVDLKFHAGEIHAFIGANGAGSQHFWAVSVVLLCPPEGASLCAASPTRR